MEGYQDNVQALLRDIESNHGTSGHEQQALPYSKPGSNGSKSQVQASRHHQQPIYGKQALEPSNAYHQKFRDEDDFVDDYCENASD